MQVKNMRNTKNLAKIAKKLAQKLRTKLYTDLKILQLLANMHV